MDFLTGWEAGKFFGRTWGGSIIGKPFLNPADTFIAQPEGGISYAIWKFHPPRLIIIAQLLTNAFTLYW